MAKAHRQYKVAVYFGSREIYADMIPSAKSLLLNSDVDKIYLLIEDDVFPYELCNCIETINIRDVVPKIFDPQGMNYRSGWTYIGLIRGALTKVFPDIDTILSIDCDTIVDKDVSDLWDFQIDDYYFAGVREPLLSGTMHIQYINAGVTLINLKKMREDGKDDEIIDTLNRRKLPLVAQDAMNMCCQGGILYIPSDYNVCNYTAPTDNKKIIHYAGIRNTWRDLPIVQKYREIPWGQIKHG